MREILYRGKATLSITKLDELEMEHDNGWMYGAYLDGYIISGALEATEEYITIEQWCKVDPKTVGQYTGLKDIKRTKIYEGDIVRMHYFFENFDPDTLGAFEDERTVIGVVEMGSCATYTQCADGAYSWDHFLEEPEEELEVIDNIHENPANYFELLEAKTND